MNANEIVAGQYDEDGLFPHLVGTDQQSSLANSQRMRTMVRADTDIPDSMETSFPPRDEALQALIPEGLKWSVKTGHEFRPHLTIPRSFTRPISRAASVYEVKSPLSVTARVIKTPDQSPNQSPQGSPTRSPTRSLMTIEEDSSTESNLVLKRRLKSHSGRARKKLFGDNGWLDDHRPPQTPRRRPSVMRQLGKKLKELVGLPSQINDF